MGIFNRLSKIVKSNINSVMDKVEDPAKILEQDILDMENQYSKAKKSVASAKGEEIKLNKKIDTLTVEVDKWLENAKLALSKKNEELAKKALSKKSELEEELKVVTEDRDSIAAHTVKLVADLKEMEKKISDARRKKELIKSRLETANAKKMMMETKSSIDGIGKNSFDSFNKMEDKANRIINEVDAMEELNGSLKEKDLDDEFENLKSNNGVDLELEKLKAELNKL